MSSSTFATLTVVFAIGVLSPFVADVLGRTRLNAVVVEIVAGVVVGPHVTGIAHLSPTVDEIASVGLTLLIFLAGFEIDFSSVRGRPFLLAGAGWLVSVALALAAGVAAQLGGRAAASVVIAIALTTTALGMVMPMWRDVGLSGTRFGTDAMAAGIAGELGPIVLISLFLVGEHPVRSSLILVAFAVASVAAAFVASRRKPGRVLETIARHTHSSSQLPFRLAVLVILALLWMAARFGLDVLLGAFAAGVVVRLGSGGVDLDLLGMKLDAVAYGVFVPVFFVVTGMRLDVHELVADPWNLARMAVFLVAFLVVRGVPVPLLYRRDLPRGERLPLALFSAAALPLVVVVAELGVSAGLITPGTEATLVGAAMISVVAYPPLALHLLVRNGFAVRGPAPAPPDQLE